MVDTSITKESKWLSISRIFSIPVVIAIATLFLNNNIQKQSINRDYVQMAVSILQDQNSSGELRIWATEILNKKAPVPLQENLIKGLNDGIFIFPTTTGIFINSEGSLSDFFIIKNK